MNVRHFLVCTIVSGALLSAPAGARIWVEKNAGDLPSTAEGVGGGLVDEIDGHLDYDINTNLWDIDLFRIRIDSPGAFSAHTALGTNVASFITDPVLFLFGVNGHGIYMNDDTSSANLQSTLPLSSPLGPLMPGFYFLGIAWSFTDPQSTGGSIFPLYEAIASLPFDGVYGSTGAGGLGALSSWLPAGPSNFDLGANYRILLTGAAGVPEPGTLALVGIALAGLFARRGKLR